MTPEQDITQEIFEKVVNLELEEIPLLIGRALELGISAREILSTSLMRGMNAVGKKYESNEYFLPELLRAGEIMKAALSELSPYLKDEGRDSRGVIVLGTVKGDIHDVGKNVFGMMAQSAGFEVVDLGVDVDADRFADKVQEVQPDIVGISALLSTTQGYIREIVRALEVRGLREGVRVIAGGGTLREDVGKEMGVDAVVQDAIQGVEECRKWVEE